MLKIKNYGEDRPCNTVDELHRTLSEHYQGQHVSIVYKTKPHGMLRTIFVTVSNAGQVRNTYGDEEPVDFNTIRDNLLTPTVELEVALRPR